MTTTATPTTAPSTCARRRVLDDSSRIAAAAGVTDDAEYFQNLALAHSYTCARCIAGA